MGTVYRVKDKTTGAHLALKVMQEQSPQHLLRFKQEFRVVAELHHPNLVHLFDLGLEDGRWFYTMELIDGRDLLTTLAGTDGQDAAHGTPRAVVPSRTWIVSDPSLVGAATDPVSDREASMGASTGTLVSVEVGASDQLDLDARDSPTGGYPGRDSLTSGDGEGPERLVACDVTELGLALAQILDALEFLHNHDIVHGDLKPSNTLVSTDGAVRLLDFGLAFKTRSERAGRSRETAISGTPAYMAPEQCLGQVATPASDMYALGCMLFQLLTGRLPFRGTVQQQMSAHVQRPPPRVESYVSCVPATLAELCRSLLAKKPDERPGIEDVRLALDLPRTSAVAPTPAISMDGDIGYYGRWRERRLLSLCLDRAEGGEPQLALVTGASGIGKTALSSTVAAQARERGFLCLYGRCYEREHVPFVAFDRAVDALITTALDWPAERLESLRGAIAAARRIFPALGVLLADAAREASPLESEPRALHQLAVEGFCQLLTAAYERSPLLLILDDLQWADEDSVTLCETVIARASGPILLLGLVRQDPNRELPIVDRLLSIGRAATTEIALDKLEARHASRLLEAAAGRPVPPGVLAMLIQAADGNPFLLANMARHNPVGSVSDNRAPASKPGEVSDHVTGWLRALIDDLSPGAERLLSLAAAQGGDIAKPLLHAAGGQSRETFERSLGELFSKRLIKIVSGGVSEPVARLGSRLDLYHDRLRQHAYQRLDQGRRRVLHEQLAGALEGGVAQLDAEALFRHFSAAGRDGKRRHYALLAADQAAEKLAFGRAAQLVELVLQDPGDDVPRETLAGYWERVGDLRYYAGQAERALEPYECSLAIWRALGASSRSPAQQPIAQLRLFRGLARCAFLLGQIDRMCRAFADGLALLGLPWARTKAERYATIAWLRASLAVSEVSATAARQASLWEKEQVRFFDFLSRSVVFLWPLIGIESSLRCEVLGQRLDLPTVHQHALASKAGVSAMLRRLSPSARRRAHKDLDRAETLADRHQLRLGRAYVMLNRSLLYISVDDERALRENRAAQVSIAGAGMSEYQDASRARMFELLILKQLGRYDELLLCVEQILTAQPVHFMDLAVSLMARISVLARTGCIDEAERDMARMTQHVAGKPECGITFQLLSARCQLAVAEGRFEQAVKIVTQAQQLRTRLGGPGTSFLAMEWRFLQLYASLGLARAGRLARRVWLRAQFEAQMIIRAAPWDFPCLGHWAQCLLAHSRGHTRIARRALRRALDESRERTEPYKRWLCLHAAHDLKALDTPRAAELAELERRHGFVVPRGWR